MDKTLEDFKKHSELVLDGLKKEIAGVRSNRPSPTLIEDIKVNYYDQLLPLKQVGSITIEPPRELRVQVWDKGALSAVLKAIENSNLGLSANVQDNIVRVFLPELSEERRQEFVKHVKQIAEKCRIQLRHERDEANKRIQKGFDGSEIGEDQKFKLKEEVQKQTDKMNGEIERILENKIKEINI